MTDERLTELADVAASIENLTRFPSTKDAVVVRWAVAEIERLRKALEAVLASAYPNPIEHPAMAAAWTKARAALSGGAHE